MTFFPPPRDTQDLGKEYQTYFNDISRAILQTNFTNLANNNILQYNEANQVWENFDIRSYIDAQILDTVPYCATGSGVDIDGTAATMNIATEQVSDTNYSLSSNEITITAAGTYRISYSMVINDDSTAGDARSSVTTWVEANTVKIIQSENRAYVREDSNGQGTSCDFIATISAGDTLRLIAQRALPDTDVSQGITQISINRVK